MVLHGTGYDLLVEQSTNGPSELLACEILTYSAAYRQQNIVATYEKHVPYN